MPFLLDLKSEELMRAFLFLFYRRSKLYLCLVRLGAMCLFIELHFPFFLFFLFFLLSRNRFYGRGI